MPQINIFQVQRCTLKRPTHMANFSLLTPQHMKNVQPFDPAPIRNLLDKKLHDALHYVNSLPKTTRADNSFEKIWFPIPQNPDNLSNQTPNQKYVFKEINALEELGKLDPQANQSFPIKVF